MSDSEKIPGALYKIRSLNAINWAAASKNATARYFYIFLSFLERAETIVTQDDRTATITRTTTIVRLSPVPGLS